MDHLAAVEAIASQRHAFEQLLGDTASAGAARGGIKHLDYLSANWMSLPMWQSWSDFGRVRASATLRITIDGVIPTTNHLESFNGILKRKHLASFLHSGHRLRFDSLIHILITRILPGIFSHRQAQKEYSNWLTLRFQHHSGGENLVLVHDQYRKDRDLQKRVPMCWWETDPQRDAAAREAVTLGRLSISRRDLDTYVTTCSSSKPPTSPSVEPSYYTVELCRSGKASCSCPDFQLRGGACKHLRAVRLCVDRWIANKQEAPFFYPQSRVHAEEVASRSQLPTFAEHQMTSTAFDSPPCPPAAHPRTIAWDPASIQALGGDETTIDEEGEILEVERESGESDHEYEITVCPVQLLHRKILTILYKPRMKTRPIASQ